MNYQQYKQMIESTEIDLDLYKTMLKDAASNGNDRLSAIIEVFEILSVPENFDGDVQKIWNEGMEEIEGNIYAEDMKAYAPMIWALPPDVGNSVYNTLEQMLDV